MYNNQQGVGMRTSAMFLALSAAGCFTTTHLSTVGPFVRTVGRDRDGVVIESCKIKRLEQTHHNIINVFLKTTPDTDLEFTQEACQGAFLSLAVDAPSPPPPGVSP